MKRVVQHFRHAIVRRADGVVIGEGGSLLEACRDARERGHSERAIAVDSEYNEYAIDRERVALAADGQWRMVRV